MAEPDLCVGAEPSTAAESPDSPDVDYPEVEEEEDPVRKATESIHSKVWLTSLTNDSLPFSRWLFTLLMNPFKQLFIY